MAQRLSSLFIVAPFCFCLIVMFPVGLISMLKLQPVKDLRNCRGSRLWGIPKVLQR